MPVFDQYEVEPVASYSGSYTDNVIIGSVFSSEARIARGQIASRVSGVNVQNLANRLISRNEFLSYTDPLYFGLPTKNLNVNMSSNELLYDSLMPSAGAIINRDGNDNPYFNVNFASIQVFSGFVSGSSELSSKPIVENSIFTLFSPNGVLPSGIPASLNKFVNTIWSFSFPYQSKYKNLLRSKNQTKTIDSSTITYEFDNVVTPITPPIVTNDIGSVFYLLKDDAGFKKYSMYSQLWMNTSSFATPTSNATIETMNHVNLTSYSGFQQIYFNNFKAVLVSASYAGFGETGGIITSSNGDNWYDVTKEPNNASDFYYEPYKLPIQITSWTFNTGSFAYARPIGYNDGSTNGNHYQWIGLLEGGALRNLIRNTNKGVTGINALQTNAPTRDNWEYVNLSATFGAGLDLYYIMDFDIGGTLTVAGSANSICIVGKTGFTNGLILFGTKDAAAGGFLRNTFAGGCADLADVTWLSCDFARAPAAAPLNTYMYFCGGKDPFPGSPSGIIGQGVFTTATNNPNNVIINDRSAPAAAAWGGTLPVTRAIAHNPTTGTTIVVGEGGMILRCTALDLNSGWTKITAAGGFTDAFVDVKVRYGSVGQGHWVIVGDNGEIQYSTNDGVTWYRGNTAQPNFVGGIGLSVINVGNIGLALGSSYRRIYVGSRERYVTNTLQEPQKILGGGGTLEHVLNSAILGNNTFLLARIADASGSNVSSTNSIIIPDILPSGSGNEIRPSFLEYNKSFFGFGDGIKINLTPYAYAGPATIAGSKGRSPSVLDFSLYDLYGRTKEPAQILIHKVGIRGWKYGSIGYLLSSGQVYRRGRFGQLRDVLEGRITTATLTEQGFNPYTNRLIPRTLFYPIQVAFVSGTTIYNQSRDYVTATNPSYNPYDSGIYDIYYRSGQPFFDRDNED